MADSKKAKRLSKEEMKRQLLDSMIIDEVAEFEDLNKKANEIQDSGKPVKITKWYEDIIKKERDYKRGISSRTGF